MKLNVKTTKPTKQRKTCVMIAIDENGGMTHTAKEIDQACGGFIKKLINQGAFKGSPGTTLPLFHVADSGYDLILLVGYGKEMALTPSAFRKVILSAAKAVRGLSVKEATCYLTEIDVIQQSLPWKVKQIVEAVKEGFYCFDTYKSEKEPEVTLKEFIVDIPDDAPLTSCEQALMQGLAIAEGSTFTKNLANLPSNICTPTYLAEQAKALGKQHSAITVTVLDEKELRKLGMGALLAVAQGSEEKPKLICLEYQGGQKKQAAVALIGKGVTFDSGGNSLKSPDNMVGMKYDMCGAATVLGCFKAAALLHLPINLVGIIPAVENMPGGTAYNPEDILISMSGQTIEVISTDAEGRLILGDALTYCERYQPDVVIDIATLTGAVVIALGMHATGLMANHEPLAKALLDAGMKSNDRAWPLPLWDEYQEQIKSPFADIANTGGRAAGPITAACFLSRFAKKFHWAHLDVAGTAAVMGGTQERLATGRPVPMLMQYLIDRSTHTRHED